MALSPGDVRFTDHAVVRAERRRIGLDLVEEVVVEMHGRRRVNGGGAARWRVAGRGIIVVYDWPSEEDPGGALVRSVWRE